MIGVHLSSTQNSTMFTDCCNIAITDTQRRCPKCKEIVYPGTDTDKDRTPHEINKARWAMAYRAS